MMLMPSRSKALLGDHCSDASPMVTRTQAAQKSSGVSSSALEKHGHPGGALTALPPAQWSHGSQPETGRLCVQSLAASHQRL